MGTERNRNRQFLRGQSVDITRDTEDLRCWPLRKGWAEVTALKSQGLGEAAPK